MDRKKILELLEQAKTLRRAFDKAYDLLNPLRPSAAEFSYQVARLPEVSAEEVMPGKMVGQEANECADMVITAADALNRAMGNLALLDGVFNRAKER